MAPFLPPPWGGPLSPPSATGFHAVTPRPLSKWKTLQRRLVKRWLTSKLSFFLLGCHTSNAKRDVTELEKAAFHCSTASFASFVTFVKYFMLLAFRSKFFLNPLKNRTVSKRSKNVHFLKVEQPSKSKKCKLFCLLTVIRLTLDFMTKRCC